MNDKSVILSVFHRFLQCQFCLIVAFAQGLAKSCAKSEFQLAGLIQESDQILNTFETGLVKITVQRKFKAMRCCMKRKIILEFFAKIQQVFVECDVPLLEVRNADIPCI